MAGGGTAAGTLLRALGRQHSLHTGAVCCHAGAVGVLVDLHGDEVGRDGDNQCVPDDGQDPDGLQNLQPDSCRRGAGGEAPLTPRCCSSGGADQATAQGQVWHGQNWSGKEVPSPAVLSSLRGEVVPVPGTGTLR